MKRWLLALTLLSSQAVYAAPPSEQYQQQLRSVVARRKAFKHRRAMQRQVEEARIHAAQQAAYDAAVASGLAYGCSVCGKQHRGRGHHTVRGR
jgi:hypothetical protein